MPAFTLGKLAKLYGMHRSTVYEAVARGRVSAGMNGQNQKVVELSEAIRVWGEPPSDPTAKPDTRHPAAAPDPTPPTDTLQPLLEELRLLREEVAHLRQAMMLLEHKPAPSAEPAAPRAMAPAPQSFADLLASLD